ncbi:carbonic anhydrase [Streptomyces sp. NBRC 110611]|nr:carbonic anhydrase [Streptomyces sp. NBRC 110611]
MHNVIERVTTSVLPARAAGLTGDGDIIAEHIWHTVDLFLDRSRVLADHVAAGKTAVVGLSYRLADGSVRLVTARGLPKEAATPGPARLNGREADDVLTRATNSTARHP